MILYRPVGLQELELIYDSGMKVFPARLPNQPIFYPVLQLEYARQVASGWNAKSGQSAGYVTQFKVDDHYIDQFEVHKVGGSQYQEYWIPEEDLEEFNKQIIGHIKVLEAHFGDAFQGFIPDKFGLEGKNAVAQFTQLANTFIYKRMDFYLEIKRNHKAIFLNYPFWQQHDSKNQGLKEKVLQGIREAWYTSFPKTPLADPVSREITDIEQTDPHPPISAPVEDVASEEEIEDLSANRLKKNVSPIDQPAKPSGINSVPGESSPSKKTDSRPLAAHGEDGNSSKRRAFPRFKEFPSLKPSGTHFLGNSIQKDVPSEKKARPLSGADHAHNESAPKSPDSHFVQGVKLGLSEKYAEAVAELSKAVEENPESIVVRTSLGVALHRSGQDDRALACYEAALKIDPRYAEAHYFRANILYGQGNVSEALAGYTLALGLKPELVEAHQNPVPQDRLTDYSDAPAEMHRISRPARRILDLSKSLDTNPRQINLLKERAAEYSRLWNYEQAIVDYSSSLAIYPEDAITLHLRGVAYEQIGQSHHAMKDYQQAMSIDPKLAEEYFERGVTYGKMGNFRQSIASLTDGIRLDPQNPNGYFNRGTTFFQMGDLENAIEDFSIVLKLSANDEAAYYWRGITYEEAGHQGEAIADYKQFLSLSQDLQAREEIEQRLRRWNVETSGKENNQMLELGDKQKIDQAPTPRSKQDLDLYDLILALGERALESIWFGNDVVCYGEKEKELYALSDNNQQIQGRDFLEITSGIRQTIAGDFQAFDPGANFYWLFIHAWEGSGFYVETNDPKINQSLKAQFPSVEGVDGAPPPYEGLFIHIK
jgi:tetratricopeptide (TPR) repeat protein